jgi:hypothetical protein
LEQDKKDKSVEEFFAKLKDFAFYEDLKTSLAADGTTLKLRMKKRSFLISDKQRAGIRRVAKRIAKIP